MCFYYRPRQIMHKQILIYEDPNCLRYEEYL